MLSTYLVKQIFSHLLVNCKRGMMDNEDSYFYLWRDFALVNKQWFLITKQLMISHSIVRIDSLKDEDEDEDEDEDDDKDNDEDDIYRGD
ncbi:hypothetical protein CYY_000643, partial [Polysphondylium violaceum]